MQQVDENIERYIISFLDCTCVSIEEYLIKAEHRKVYKSVVDLFDRQKVYDDIFSDINFKSHRFAANSGRSLYFRIGLNPDGTYVKSRTYRQQGITFVLLGGEIFMIKKDRRILDFFGFTTKQKYTEWYLSKILDLYPII